ncbi:YfhJ family protein [Salibacterium aidingense]|uniref:YfhJ family protein n=1 Tax=Salibacterium aidingense TaxID=384933 RepID=UPI0003FD959A|nr:YfhJ family protein [Salibacterium aidingense]
MEVIFQRLADQLLKRNTDLTPAQARSWVEYLWEDFEAARAKAGREYKGAEVTEAVVKKWLEQYGPHLHRYQPTNKKFEHLDTDQQKN